MIQFQAKYLKALFAFTSQRDIRYYLKGINITPHQDGGAVLVATDGHRMLCIRDVKAICKEEATFYLNKDALRHCGNAFSEAVCQINPITERLVIMGVKPVEELYVQARKCFVEFGDKAKCYPDWRKVIPDFSELKPIVLSALNYSYLADALKINPSGGKHSGVRLWSVGGAFDAAVLQYEDCPEVFAIIMPMHSDPHQKSLLRISDKFGFKPKVVAVKPVLAKEMEHEPA